MITVKFLEGVEEARAQLFTSAAARWNKIVETAFSPLVIDEEELTGLVIEASIQPIDGELGVLGQAGPTVLLSDNQLPAKGIMQFDLADVERLERENSLEDVILHEMGHVIGFGTLWNRFDLIEGSGTNNPVFTGSATAREYADLLGASASRTVPVANTGGIGTREGHWRELIFGDELMTGFLSGSNRALSRLSIAAFEDLGYEVNYDAADEYSLPTFFELAEKGITEAVRKCDLCRMGRPEPVLHKR